MHNTDIYEVRPINEAKELKTSIRPCIFQQCSYPLRFRKKQSGVLIGIIKAYKKDKNGKFIDDDSALSNPHNEIYTIDIEQEIQLRAFVYEGQRTYTPQKEIKDTSKQIKQNHALQRGNITKTIIANEHILDNIAEEDIKWAFKFSDDNSVLLDSSLQKDKKGFIRLNQSGASIQFTLKDILKDKGQVNNLINKTITFFAYDESIGINQNTIDNKKANNVYDSNLKKTRKEVKVEIDNAYAQYRVSHYKDDWNERQIQTDRITSVTLKIIQTRFSLDFDGQTLQFLENERVMGEWNASSTNKLEKNNTINVTYNSENLNLKGIDCVCKDELCYLFRYLNIEKNLKIPLNVEYQKRILILIERFKETTESTLARMNIYIDKKRVKQNGEIEKEKGIKPIDDDNFPYAYILDRPGPDCIKSEINLRIPEGRYKAEWHNYGIRINTIQIYNRFVSLGRNILIHNGNTPKDSEGCILINDYFMDNVNDIIFQNKQENITKEQRLTKSLTKDFTKEILGKSTNNINNFVKEYIEVRVRNNFKKHRINISLTFDGEFLSILINNRITHSFQAVSGREQKINNKYYFTYEKERQMLKNEGPIPEGEYFITPLSENIDDGMQYWDKMGRKQKIAGWLSFIGKNIGSWAKATPAWGKIRIPIQPKTKIIINAQGQSIIRDNFFMHGGIGVGSAGCIDLWKNNDEFFKVLLEYVNKYRDDTLQNQGRVPLSVKYKNGIKIECDSDYYTKQCMEFNNEK